MRIEYLISGRLLAIEEGDSDSDSDARQGATPMHAGIARSVTTGVSVTSRCQPNIQLFRFPFGTVFPAPAPEIVATL